MRVGDYRSRELPQLKQALQRSETSIPSEPACAQSLLSKCYPTLPLHLDEVESHLLSLL